MAYTKQTWSNNPSTATPLSAERLTYLETQYDEAVAAVPGLIAADPNFSANATAAVDAAITAEGGVVDATVTALDADPASALRVQADARHNATIDGKVTTGVAPKLDKTEAATTYGRVANGKTQLVNWFNKLRSSPGTAKIMFTGDSTSEGSTEAVAIVDRLKNVHTLSGEGLEGVLTANITQNGLSGLTQSSWGGVNHAAIYVQQVVTAAPDLLVYSLGINDVKAGAVGQVALTTGIRANIDYLRATLPNMDIVLRMPNSFLSDDPTAANFLTPLASSQAYTTILRDTYTSLVGQWPNVAVWDSQDRIFGRNVRTFVQAGGLMKDTLHPSKAWGYPLIADYLVADLIGHDRRNLVAPRPVDMVAASRPANPYTFGDMLDRADSATSPGIASSGQTWVVSTGTLGILGKRFYLPAAANTKATVDPGHADGEFGMTFTAIDMAVSTNALMFRYQDASNYLFFRCNVGVWELGKIAAGAAVVIQSSFMAGAAGDRIKVVCQGTTVRCYVNDKMVSTNTVTDFATSTPIGLQATSMTTRMVDPYARRLPVL